MSDVFDRIVIMVGLLTVAVGTILVGYVAYRFISIVVGAG